MTDQLLQAQARRLAVAADTAAGVAERARELLDGSIAHDAAIDSSALVSIALSLSVIAEIVAASLVEEAQR